MLEVRYIKNTGMITAWAGGPTPTFVGGHLGTKEGEEIMVIDVPTPTCSPGDYLIVDGQLKLVKEPELPRDLVAEIDKLDIRLKKLEGT